MKLTLHRHEYRLRHPFTIARGTKTHQPALIVSLEDGEHCGFGEATPNAFYENSLEGLAADVEAVRTTLEAWGGQDPEALWSNLAPHFRHDRFGLCAIDEAAWDLWGKRRGKPLHELWGLSSESLVPTSYTIGLDEPEVMIAKMRERGDWPVFKIKLGRGDDLELVRRLRAETDALFRVDANAGWTFDEALEKTEALAELGVEFVEQPLPVDEAAAMVQLKARSPLPLVADESCIVEDDVLRCAEQFHGVNIKLMKCGGITPARRMLAAARKAGLRTMIGCMTESTVGVSAIAQLLPALDWVDMDGPELIEGDPARGVSFDRGRVLLPEDLGGSGVRYAR